MLYKDLNFGFKLNVNASTQSIQTWVNSRSLYINTNKITKKC